MKRIFSITLAFYFLATSVGFGVNTHFCRGKAIKTAIQLTQHELSCGMKMETYSCEVNTTSFKKKSCCENHFEAFQVDDNFETVDVKVNLHPVFVTTFYYSFLLPRFSELDEPTFLAYSAPLVIKNITILFENFRI